MGDVAQRGTTVLISSHNLRELEDVCDHVGILSHGKVLVERSLTDLQDNIVKLQIAFDQPELPSLPKDLNILHTSQLGRVYTLIVRGHPGEIRSRMEGYHPLILEVLPLSLEEIFIYELGGEHYGVRDIIL
jgi:ABC-2 type transport system ATP-binding protein